MKILFLFPPQWVPISPHFAIPTLLGQFKDSPFEAIPMDLNVDFYNKILTHNYVSDALKTAKGQLPQLKEEIKQVYDKDKKFEDYPIKWQNKIAKASMIQDYLAEHASDISSVSRLVETSVNILKSKEHFYNPKLFISSIDTINKALEICSMPYYPTQLCYLTYTNQLLKLDFESIKYYVFDESTNVFLDYYKERLEEIKSHNADYIGVSINSSSQIIAGLTLSHMLMKETNAHVNIGGNYFGRLVENLQERPEFFELFCHSLSVEEGEKPCYELARHIAGEIPIEDVSNLMYLKDGKVVINNKIEPLKLNEMKPASLEGYDLSKYFVPEIVMPFQASRGCYWGKCSFCDHDFGMSYNIKDLDILVQQIKMFKEKYGITKFEFIDEAISPAYMEEMSKRFIKEDLNITFFCDARLENSFTKEVCEIAHKAGLKMILWGFESGSNKVMELINKGIDVENRLTILRNAREAGIYNFAFIFFGFPAETKEDALMTMDMIFANTDIINSYGRSVFTMGKHTTLRKSPEKYGVIGKTYQEAEFSPTYVYEASGMNKDELNEMLDLCTKRANEAYGNVLSFHLLSREIILLYLDKYGADAVCSFKFEGQKNG